MLFGKERGVNPNCCRKRGADGVLAILLPGAAWLAMPKCPVCLAGYLAFFTGMGVSADFAAGLWVLVIFVTVAALFLFAFSRFKPHKTAKT